MLSINRRINAISSDQHSYNAVVSPISLCVQLKPMRRHCGMKERPAVLNTALNCPCQKRKLNPRVPP